MSKWIVNHKSLISPHIPFSIPSTSEFYLLSCSVSSASTVGAPIPVEKISQPTQEDIDAVHTKYVNALRDLFYAHREEYADANAQLTIA